MMHLEQQRLPENSQLRFVIDNFIGSDEKRYVRGKKHKNRVIDLCSAIGKKIGLDTENLKALRMSASLHDLGLLRVPEETIEKPTPLTDDEVALIREHPQTGYQLLSFADYPWPVAEIVLQHHEHIDGSGYPNKLTADQIRIEAKIICVADTIEAITSNRPHRRAATMMEATAELEDKCGLFYDPDVVHAFLQLVHGSELFVKGWSEKMQ